ncbi:hypothetical protein [Streptomyces sp. NBC_01794]|uniref:hypothetical protein n=1 Tax=Streptomyces sp. NBC_01794 TaxID=2975942 RepID=UPI00308FBF12|nr:hypothetical protein OIE54_11880 [Streptomyces sp. NBC_01794]
MPTTPELPATAASLNDLIRALWVDGVLTDEARYRELVVAWARAERDGLTQAA